MRTDLASTNRRRGLTIFETLLILLLLGVLVVMLRPAVQPPRSGIRHNCKSHLKQIALALHNYHDSYGTLPPAYIPDEDGRPMHSWRVLILPFLDEELAKRYDFSQPWDSEHNRKLIPRMPDVFRCPDEEHARAGETSYVAIVHDDAVFRGREPVTMKQITGGTTNAICVGEYSTSGIPWTKPSDLYIDLPVEPGTFGGLRGPHEGVVHVIICDGSVRHLFHDLDSKTFEQLVRRDKTTDGDW